MAGIRIRLELEDGTFTTRMLHAGESIDQFNAKLGGTALAFQRVEPAHRSFIGHMRDVIVIVAAARLAFENLRTVTTSWAGEIIKVNAEFERLTYLIAGMSKAADPMKDAIDQVKALRQEALQTPYSLKMITDTFVKIKATGIDPLNGSMRATLDTVAAFGGSESQLKRASLAIQEMAGKGVVQTKELRRQLGQDIPRAVELMARALGVSQAQLSGVMEKGTLDAKTSMAAMFGEWERTFGGSSARLMQTFNGMLSQTVTLLQNLALNAGNAGFFNETKKQLKDFNEFLSGRTAGTFAAEFGNAMGEVTRGLREGLEWAIKFRHEIVGVIEILAGGFITKVAIGTILSFGTALRGAMVTMRAFGAEWAALKFAQNINYLQMLAGQIDLLGLGVSRTTYLLRSMGIAVGFLGVALSFTAEFIVPIAVAIAAVAYAFGLFEDKINDAYEAVKKYGVQDAGQLRLVEEKLKREERALELAKKRAELSDDRARRGVPFGRFDAQNDSRDVDAIQKRRDETAQTLAKARIDDAKRESDKELREVQASLDARHQLRERDHDKDLTADSKAYSAEFDLKVKNHQDITTLNDAYQKSNRAKNLVFYQQEYDDLEQAIADQQERQTLGYASAADVAAALIHKQLEVADKIRKLKAQSLGPVVNAKGLSLQEALDKADSIIKTVTGSTEKYKAELAGVNGEIAQFFYKMSNGGREKKLNIFGDEELEGKLRLAKDLFVQMEALKEQAKGREKLDHDINAAYEKQVEREFQLKNGRKSEADQIRIRMQEGIYGGLKPIAELQASMKKLLGETSSSANTAVTSMNALLGADMQQKGKGLLGVLRDIAGTMNGFRLNVDTPKMIDVGGGAKPVVASAGTPDENAKLAKIDEKQKANDLLEAQQKLAAKTEELREVVSSNTAAHGKNNTHLRELNVALANPRGPYKNLGNDAASEKIRKDAIAAARAADASDKAQRDAAKAITRSERISENIANDKKSLAEREADLQHRYDEGARYKTPSKQFHIADKYDKEITELQKSGGSPDKIADLQALKRRNIDVEAASVIQAEQKKSDAIEKGLMTAADARKFEHDNEVKRLDEELAKVSRNSQFRVEAEKEVARAKDLLAKKELADSPIGREMKNYIDVGNNLQQAAAGWTNTISDDFAKMVTKNKVNFKSLADSIVQDMVRIGIRGAIGSLFGPMFGLSGAVGGGAGKIGGGAGKINTGNLGGTAGGLAALHHDGGIAGSVRATRMVDISTFIGAQKFHNGGFPGLGRDEVPAIVKRGEEIDWPEKLAKKYGGRGGSVMHNNVTVNATGGRPQDNQDLADRVGRAVEEAARAMVGKEIRTQMKPGGMAYA